MNNDIITHITESSAFPDESGCAQVIRTLCLTLYAELKISLYSIAEEALKTLLTRIQLRL